MIGSKMSILSWIDFEDATYITPLKKRIGMYVDALESFYIYMPVELSLDLTPLFLSNYPVIKKSLLCSSETKQNSAHIWASLVHFKSRL